MGQLNKKQIVLARHALGLPNSSRRSYRNRFLIAEGSPQFEQWLAMAVDGYAVRRPKFGGGKLDLFILTLDGARAALKPGEELDRMDFPYA